MSARKSELSRFSFSVFVLKLERTPIVPGFESKSIPKIETPEEFFQRTGVRGPGDPKAGQPIKPSGSITVRKNGEIVVTPGGAQ